MAQRDDEREYSAFVVRAWSKETLAVRMRQKLDPYSPEQIIIVTAGADFQLFWPARRNLAIMIVKRDVPIA